MTRAAVLVAVVVLVPASSVFPSGTPQVEPIGIYVTPYYNSDGPVVRVGKFSDGLAAPDLETVRATVGSMRGEYDTLPVEAMYVAAVRLHDLGDLDEAVRWFYAAQFRARLFVTLLDSARVGEMGSPAFEYRAAFGAFYQLAGPPLNGYAGCSQEKWLAAIDAALTENETVVDLGAIYPDVAFVARDRWPGEHRQIVAGLEELSAYLRDNWDEIRSGRAANNADARYCP